jgi:hypothetical protein
MTRFVSEATHSHSGESSAKDVAAAETTGAPRTGASLLGMGSSLPTTVTNAPPTANSALLTEFELMDLDPNPAVHELVRNLVRTEDEWGTDNWKETWKTLRPILPDALRKSSESPCWPRDLRKARKYGRESLVKRQRSTTSTPSCTQKQISPRRGAQDTRPAP